MKNNPVVKRYLLRLFVITVFSLSLFSPIVIYVKSIVRENKDKNLQNNNDKSLNTSLVKDILNSKTQKTFAEVDGYGACNDGNYTGTFGDVCAAVVHSPITNSICVQSGQSSTDTIYAKMTGIASGGETNGVYHLTVTQGSNNLTTSDAPYDNYFSYPLPANYHYDTNFTAPVVSKRAYDGFTYVLTTGGFADMHYQTSVQIDTADANTAPTIAGLTANVTNDIIDISGTTDDAQGNMTNVTIQLSSDNFATIYDSFTLNGLYDGDSIYHQFTNIPNGSWKARVVETETDAGICVGYSNAVPSTNLTTNTTVNFNVVSSTSTPTPPPATSTPVPPTTPPAQTNTPTPVPTNTPVPTSTPVPPTAVPTATPTVRFLNPTSPYGTEVVNTMRPTFKWNANLIDKYKVYLDNNLIQTTTSTQYELPYNIVGSHTWKVLGFLNDDTQVSTMVNIPFSIKVPNLPITVYSPAANSTVGKDVTFSWKSNGDTFLDHYEVYLNGKYLGSTSQTQLKNTFKTSGQNNWQVYGYRYGKDSSGNLQYVLTGKSALTNFNEDINYIEPTPTIVPTSVSQSISPTSSLTPGVSTTISTTPGNGTGTVVTTTRPITTDHNGGNGGSSGTIQTVKVSKDGSVLAQEDFISVVASNPIFDNKDLSTIAKVEVDDSVKTVEATSRAVGVVSTLAIISSPAFMGLTSPNLFLSGLFLIVGKRRKKSWGVVYDANSNSPIPFAAVRLMDAKSNKFIKDTVTDTNGRFAFAVDPGNYYFEVKAAGYQEIPHTNAPLLEDIYRGENITIRNKDVSIGMKIPLVALNGKYSENIISIIRRNLPLIFRVLVLIVFIVSLVSFFIASTLLNLLVVITYFLLSIYLFYNVNVISKSLGLVYDTVNGKRLPSVFVKMRDTKSDTLIQDLMLTDERGRFIMMLDPGEYKVQFETTDKEVKETTNGKVISPDTVQVKSSGESRIKVGMKTRKL